MRDLTDPRWMGLKGALFLTLGCLAAGLLLAEHRDARTAFLLAVSVWAFARFYYFAFYVIGRYIDPTYRFSGLWSFVRYAVARRQHRRVA
jgi:hypothetical protein